MIEEVPHSLGHVCRETLGSLAIESNHFDAPWPTTPEKVPDVYAPGSPFHTERSQVHGVAAPSGLLVETRGAALP